ncbi:MAG: tetratricopeptide repeat protein [Verrucomicrobia bacterium]|nr:tetratricopeptide repeat protein [Verrucomicrobiota bacterium]
MDSETPQSKGFYEFLAWVELNKKNLITGGIAVVVLGFGLGVYRWRGDQRELLASQALLEINPPGAAQSTNTPPSKAPEYFKMAAEFAGTAAAERALLLAAGDLYVHGNYVQAQSYFEHFLKNNNGSPLAFQAALGTAACLDAQNKTDEALAKYREVDRYSSGAGVSQARLAMARIYEAKNQPELALKAYDELAKAKDVNVWNSEARTLREALLQKHPQLAPTNAPAAASAAPPGAITIPMSAFTNQTTSTAQVITITNQAAPAAGK